MKSDIGWMPTAVGTVVVAPAKMAWLYLHLIAAALLLPHALTPERAAAAFVVAFVTVCVGHSVGLHRGVIHGAYRCSPRVRGALSFLFVFSGLGGPLSWIRLHEARDHWQSQPECPEYFKYQHGIFRDYLWNLHTTFRPASPANAGGATAHDSDGWLSFLEKTWWLWNVAFFVIVAATASWETAIVVCTARIVVTILMHWYVGFMAHKHGERRFSLTGASEEGRNVWWLGPLSFGEGFHNTHHAFPRSARMGEHARELDFGYAVIRVFCAVGLVDDVVELDDARSGRESAVTPTEKRSLAQSALAENRHRG